MSKSIKTETRNRTSNGALVSSALAICFFAAGAIAPAHACLNANGTLCSATYSTNNNTPSATPASTQNTNANRNYGRSGLGWAPTETWSVSAEFRNRGNQSRRQRSLERFVPLQATSQTTTVISVHGGPQYYRVQNNSNENANDRQPLNNGNFYGRAPGLQRGERIEEVNTIPGVRREHKIAEQTQVRPRDAKAVYVRPIAQYNHLQTQRGNYSVGFDQIQIRGVGGNQGIQYGRSLVQFNGQTNLANQIERIEVVRHRPTPLNRIPLLNSRFDRQAANNRDYRSDLLINVTVRPVNQR